MTDIDVQSVRQYFLDLQAQICSALEQEDGRGRFVEDHWERASGAPGLRGGGRTCVLTDGNVFE